MQKREKESRRQIHHKSCSTVEIWSKEARHHPKKFVDEVLNYPKKCIDEVFKACEEQLFLEEAGSRTRSQDGENKLCGEEATP